MIPVSTGTTGIIDSEDTEWRRISFSCIYSCTGQKIKVFPYETPPGNNLSRPERTSVP